MPIRHNIPKLRLCLFSLLQSSWPLARSSLNNPKLLFPPKTSPNIAFSFYNSIRMARHALSFGLALSLASTAFAALTDQRFHYPDQIVSSLFTLHREGDTLRLAPSCLCVFVQPYKVDNDPSGRGPQFGYNRCNSTTEGPNSDCQLAMLNSIDGASFLFQNIKSYFKTFTSCALLRRCIASPRLQLLVLGPFSHGRFLSLGPPQT